MYTTWGRKNIHFKYNSTCTQGICSPQSISYKHSLPPLCHKLAPLILVVIQQEATRVAPLAAGTPASGLISPAACMAPQCSSFNFPMTDQFCHSSGLLVYILHHLGYTITCTQTHTHAHTRTHAHACTLTHACTHMHTHTHTHTHTCIHHTRTHNTAHIHNMSPHTDRQKIQTHNAQACHTRAHIPHVYKHTQRMHARTH